MEGKMEGQMGEQAKKREGSRAVSFIDKETAAWLHREGSQQEGSQQEDGLCLARFHADIEADGVTGWREGEIVTVDGQQFEITQTGKRCFSECGLLQRTGRRCPLAGGVAFGKPAEVKRQQP